MSDDLPDIRAILTANSVKERPPLDHPTLREDGRVCLVKEVSEEIVNPDNSIQPEAYRTWCNEKVSYTSGTTEGTVTCLECMAREDHSIRVFTEVGVAVGNLKAITKLELK